MERLLKLIDQDLGGSAAWLTAHGLSTAELERLGRRIASTSGNASNTTSCAHSGSPGNSAACTGWPASMSAPCSPAF
jgi:hypothetical protein